jgi:hypothetical protein
MTNYTILIDDKQKQLLTKMLAKFSEMSFGQTRAEREECKRLEQQIDKLHTADANDLTKNSKL